MADTISESIEKLKKANWFHCIDDRNYPEAGEDCLSDFTQALQEAEQRGAEAQRKEIIERISKIVNEKCQVFGFNVEIREWLKDEEWGFLPPKK